MDLANPLELIEDFPVKETKLLIKSLKSEIGDVAKDPDYDGEADIILCVLNSLEKELGKTDSIKNLSKEKQARILADMSLLMQFMQASQNEFDDEEFEDEFDDEDENEENDDEDEDEGK